LRNIDERITESEKKVQELKEKYDEAVMKLEKLKLEKFSEVQFLLNSHSLSLDDLEELLSGGLSEKLVSKNMETTGGTNV
jgi:hypothetical protein